MQLLARLGTATARQYAPFLHCSAEQCRFAASPLVSSGGPADLRAEHMSRVSRASIQGAVAPTRQTDNALLPALLLLFSMLPPNLHQICDPARVHVNASRWMPFLSSGPLAPLSQYNTHMISPSCTIASRNTWGHLSVVCAGCLLDSVLDIAAAAVAAVVPDESIIAFPF